MMKVQMMGGVVLAAAVLLAAVVAVAAAPLVPVMDKDLESEASMRWLSVYNVSLDLAETEPRFETFKKDARYVHEFNKREDVPYKLGLNQFSDLTEEELDSGMYTGTLPEGVGNVSSLGSSGMTDDDKLLVSTARKVPTKWDWSDHGAVTPVKNLLEI